jgi:hypothetical protein
MRCGSQSLLVLPRKQVFIVLNEAIIRVSCDIWWVGEYEVTLAAFGKGNLKIAHDDLRSPQNFAPFFKIVGRKQN